MEVNNNTNENISKKATVSNVNKIDSDSSFVDASSDISASISSVINSNNNNSKDSSLSNSSSIPLDGSGSPGENALISLVTPIFNKLGYGGILGLCVGYTVKETGKIAAYFIGGTFIFLKGLQYAGFIEIKWENIKNYLIRNIDTDGDGTLGISDLTNYTRKFMKIMVFEAPIAGGFATGFYMSLLM